MLKLDRLIVGALFGYCLVATIAVWAANFFIDAALILTGFRYCRYRAALRFDQGLLLAVAAMVGAATLAGLFAVDSRKSIQPVWFILYYSAPLFLAIAFIKTPRQLLAMMGGLAASLTVSSLYAIYQATQGVIRPPGFTGDWFILAGQLSILLPFFFVFAADATRLQPRIRLLLWSAVILALGALVVNATRGAWLAVGGSLATYFTVWARNRKKIIVWLLGLILALALVAVTLNLFAGDRNARFIARDLTSAGERFRIWESTLGMIGDHPLLGVGPGNYAQQYEHKYILPSALERKSQPHAHNNILSVASEMGLLGLSAFLALFGYIIHHFWQALRRSSSRSSPGSIAALLATLGLQLHGMSDYTFLGFPTVIQTYWFLIGMLWYADQKRGND